MEEVLGDVEVEGALSDTLLGISGSTLRIVNPVSLSFILDLTYFFFWALESFASLFWLAVAVSTSKLFLLLYVSHCLADM